MCGKGDLPDVIFVSMENWHGVWRRNQNVAAGLARRFPQSKILYICLPVDLSFAFRKGHFRLIAQEGRVRPPEALDDFPNVFTFRPIKLFPRTLRLGAAVNNLITRAQVRDAASQAGLRPHPLLYINPYWGAHFVGRMGECAAIYDVGDDWTGLSVPEWERKRISEEDALLTTQADAVIVTSQWLAAMARKLREDVNIIFNGVDVERFKGVIDRSITPHPATKDWKSPVIGYAGTLHPDRSSPELILQVAQAFPEATIALVGPNDFGERELARLQAEPNVRILGPVDHTEVPGIMRAFDVCFVPHRPGAFSESNSPLKLFEYLACGIPIVSTPVAGFRDYPELVYIAEPEDFCDAIRRALTEDTARRVPRCQEAASHTWEKRIDAYVDVFEKAIGAAASTRVATELRP